MTEKMEKLFVVDLMPFLYRGHFVFLKSPRMTSSGINTSALLGLVNGLMSIVKREHPERLVLAMDPGGPTFRHRAYPPYKAQREKMPEDLAASIPYAFEVADALGIPVVRVDDFEADDVMGTIAVKGAAAGFDVYLATPDKDAAQLVPATRPTTSPASAASARRPRRTSSRSSATSRASSPTSARSRASSPRRCSPGARTR